MKKLWLSAVFAVLCGFSSYAQSLVFAQLQGQPTINTSGWNLTGAATAGDTPGDADLNNNELILTQSVNTSSGGIFYNQIIDLGTCTKWTVDFDFRIFNGTGADGIAFCFLDVPPTGFVSGGGVGIPSTANGLKVVFDTYDNGCGANPEIQILSGVGYNECAAGIVKLNNTGGNLNFIRSNGYNAARITYDGGNITVTVNGTPYLSANFPINFAGYMGFTASTGGSNDQHSIRNVTIYADVALSDAGPNKSYCTGASTQIGAPNNPDFVYSWTPATGLNQTNISNPTVTLTNTTSSPITQQYIVQTYLAANLGACPTYDTVLVTINPTYTGTVNAAICQGASYTFGSQSYNTTGSYPVTFQSVSGCDSTVTLNLTVNPAFTGTRNETICQGSSFNFGGQNYTTTGNYPVTFQTSNGCDSVVTLHLTVNPTYSISRNETICQGGSITIGAETISTAGSYIINMLSSRGCDSTVILALTVNPAFTSTMNSAICEGSSLTLGGQSFSTAGTYTVQLQTVNGCDSIITLNLSLKPVPEAPILSSNSPLPCPGDLLILEMEPVSNASYHWSGPAGHTSQNRINSFHAQKPNEGTYSAYVEVNGCKSPVSTISAVIDGYLDLQNFDFPNVVTPNGDGINETLDIDGFFDPCEDYNLLIWNRWGNMIYEQSYQSAPFDGRDKGGNKVSPGVYFYKINYGDFEKSGMITVIY